MQKVLEDFISKAGPVLVVKRLVFISAMLRPQPTDGRSSFSRAERKCRTLTGGLTAAL